MKKSIASYKNKTEIAAKEVEGDSRKSKKNL